jgi:hypothetical protein
VIDVPVCGQNHEVLRAHGLDAETLCETIAAVLGTSAASGRGGSVVERTATERAGV